MLNFRLYSLGGAPLRDSLRVTLALTFLVAGLFAQNKPAKPEPAPAPAVVPIDTSARLPIKRVVLYKNGVGYFEHAARVHGMQELSIDFTTAQLNDVLKSLTAVDLGDGRVSSVRYNSIAPLDDLKQKERIDGLSAQVSDRKRESDQIMADQNRIRENMKALKGTSEEKALLQRYVGQLDTQESRLAILRQQSVDLTTQQNQARAELDRMIMEVNVDETF
jgi:hypothetical protein